jgi:hypothetical protein
MAFAAKTSGTKTSGAKTSGAKSSDAKSDASGDDRPASDAPKAGDAKTPAATGDIALPEPTKPAKKSVADDEPKPSGPVSVFVSRKQRKVFVRQGFVELFDMPVTIADPDQPIGTHVYTAMGPTEGDKAMRWTVMSIPSSYRHPRHAERRHRRGRVDEEAKPTPAPAASSATEALNRITLPPEAVKRISELLIPGSSLIVSDNALSDETDDSTSFIVLTR